MSDISSQISLLAKCLVKKSICLGTAESCTGGLIGHLLTNEPGSSKWYAGGVVAYSNHLKTRVLNVEQNVLQKHGAVSRECVLQMLSGISGLTKADACLAISGIAGPGGGTDKKPVGTVFIGWGLFEKSWCKKYRFEGTRLEIKTKAAHKSIELLLGELVS